MNATPGAPLSSRDRAVLQAVAAGRCEISKSFGGSLVIDGLFFSDQFAGLRLAEAGLIAVGPRSGAAHLTQFGHAVLVAA